MHLDICSDKPVVRNHLTYDTAFHMPFIHIPQGTKIMSAFNSGIMLWEGINSPEI